MIFLSSIAIANGLQIKDGKVLPFEFKNVSLEVAIEEISNVLDLSVAYNKSDLKEKLPVTLKVVSAIEKEELKEYFFRILSMHNMSYLEEDFGGIIMPTRNSRDFYIPLYEGQKTPDTNNNVLSSYRMQYPFGGMFIRNMRPDLSRYGRIMDFPKARSILIYDTGKKIQYFLASLKEFDTKENFDRYIEKRKEDAIKESKKSKEEKKIAMLEDQIKELEMSSKKSQEINPTPKNDKK